MSYQDALKFLKKEMAAAFEMDNTLEGISTGAIVIDMLTGIGGFPKRRISEVFGWESCLAHDTPVHFTTFRPDAEVRHDGKGRCATNCKGGTIQRLYERFHRIPVDGKGKYLRDVPEDLEFYVPSVNEEDRIFLNRVTDVVETGVRLCHRVTTVSGRSITATPEHKFYCEDRFLPLSELRPGAHLALHMNKPYSAAEANRERPRGWRKHYFVKSHGVAGLKTVIGGYTYHRLLRSRAAIEAEMNGLDLDDYLCRLNAGALSGLTFLDRDDHVHHRDENFLNDERSNLVVISASQHGRLHAMERHNNLRYAITEERIARIEVVGELPTYDIKMAAPFNNFVAGDFVVHNSGKTTLCLMACAAAQRKGLLCAYLDVERGVDLTYATKLGFDWQDDKKGIYMTPRTFEETATAVQKFITCGEVPLVIVDSVPAMLPEDQLDESKDINDEGPIAARARKLASFLPKITKLVDESDAALVFVNQMRMRPATSRFDFGPKEQTSGGSALRFYSSLRIDMEQRRRGSITKKAVNPLTGKEEDIPVASLHRAEAFKNKIALPYREFEFLIRYDEASGIYGIDNLQSLIDLALVQGVIEASGTWFKYAHPNDPEANFRCQGKDALYAHMVRSPKIVEALRQAIGL